MCHNLRSGGRTKIEHTELECVGIRHNVQVYPECCMLKVIITTENKLRGGGVTQMEKTLQL
jgi:hypothetical protein